MQVCSSSCSSVIQLTKQALQTQLIHISPRAQCAVQQAPADALFFSLTGVATGALKQGPLMQRLASQYAPPLPQ